MRRDRLLDTSCLLWYSNSPLSKDEVQRWHPWLGQRLHISFALSILRSLAIAFTASYKAITLKLDHSAIVLIKAVPLAYVITDDPSIPSQSSCQADALDNSYRSAGANA